MPIVTIQVTREGTEPGANAVTPEQKAALIKGASQLLLDVLKKPLEATFVVIEEVDLDNWGWGGLPSPRIERSSRPRRAEGLCEKHTQDEKAAAEPASAARRFRKSRSRALPASSAAASNAARASSWRPSFCRRSPRTLPRR